MLDHIVPNSGINVENTKENLRREGVLLDAGWEVFTDVLPKHSTDTDYLKMGTIYQGIIDSTMFEDRSSRTLTLVFSTSPHIAPVSETIIRHRPYGCG